MIIECIFIKNFLGYKKGDLIYPDLKSKSIPLYIGDIDKKPVFRYVNVKGLYSLLQNDIIKTSIPHLKEMVKYANEYRD